MQYQLGTSSLDFRFECSHCFFVFLICFQIQKMSTSCPEFLALVDLLCPMVVSLFDSDLVFCPQVCSNIVYGMQNCSCTEQCVEKILSVVLNCIKSYLASFSQDIFPDSKFPDLLLLYQSLSLSLQIMPDLDLNVDLSDSLRREHLEMYQILNSRKGSHFCRRLTSLEQRLAESITSALSEEPFVVTTNELLHGFETTITIKLRPDISLQCVDGSNWSPVLNIEVGSAIDNCPSKELFNRLRASYLGQEFGVSVQIIPCNAISGKSRGALRECLQRSTDLFSSLYPACIEDSVKFAGILSGLGLCQSDDILGNLQEVDCEGNDTRASFFSVGSSADGIVSLGDCGDGGEESVDYWDCQVPFPQRGLRRSWGMPFGWIGDLPTTSTVSLSPSALMSSSLSSTQFVSSHPLMLTTQRRMQPSTFSTITASPIPQGSRVVCPPFIQVGPNPSQVISSSVSSFNSRISQHGFKNSQSCSTSPGSSALKSTESDNTFLTLNSNEILSRTKSFEDSPLFVLCPDINNSSSLSNDDEAGEGSEVDGEIALLEAQLEIKRLEARLLLLKKSKNKAI